jgi:hypothetical protein
LRKTRDATGPIARIRARTRKKSNQLVNEGRIRKEPCVVCGSREAIIHHEDYDNPFYIIWLCEEHHRQYHDGKIGLFNGKLWWNSGKLVPKSARELISKNRKLAKKYNLANDGIFADHLAKQAAKR